MTKAAGHHSGAGTENPYPIHTLPFVRPAFTDAEGRLHLRHFWTVQPSGDWLRDYATGAAFGRLALVSTLNNRSYLLAWIVEGMIDRGRFAAMETGFMWTVTVAAMGGAR
jgi:hypothetical protein